jgi:hypothetical protein
MRRQLFAAVLAALLFAPVGKAWTWPAAGDVLQPFLFDSAHPYAAGQHRGLDIGGEPGATVVAPAAGTVTFAGTVPSSGKSVTIGTADGYAVTLTHLGSITVARGAALAEGEGVGTIGMMGEAEVPAPYVHLGVRVAAEAQGYLDPLSLLPARVPAPAALVPPVVVVEPPPAPLPVAEPAPAPAADPEPEPGAPPVAPPDPPVAAPDAPAPVAVAVPVPDPPAPVAVPATAAVSDPATDPPAGASPVRPLPAEPDPAPALASAPPGVVTPGASTAEPAHSRAAPHAAGNQPMRGPAFVAARRTASAAADIGARVRLDADGEPRRGGRAVAPPLAQRPREPHAVRIADRAVAAVRTRRQARSAARPHATAHAFAAAAAPVAAIAQRPKPRQGGMPLPLLAAAALLATAVLTGLLGTVRMMVRCGTDTKEDPGRPRVAVCGGSPPPRSRGGLRRPVGRVRPLSPVEGQRRPHGERHGRARHAGDGGRRQGGQVIR